MATMAPFLQLALGLSKNETELAILYKHYALELAVPHVEGFVLVPKPAPGGPIWLHILVFSMV